MDFHIYVGAVDGDNDPDRVIRLLEDALTVFFEADRTPNSYSAYDDIADIEFSLNTGGPVDCEFDRYCPFVMSIYSRDRPKLAALGVAFAKLAASRRFHAAMTVEGIDLAATPGVPIG